jgi:hypothetical protein
VIGVGVAWNAIVPPTRGMELSLLALMLAVVIQVLWIDAPGPDGLFRIHHSLRSAPA